MKNDWDFVAKNWDSHMGDGDWFQRYIIYPSITKIICEIPKKRIIDIGCGNGHLSRYLSGLGAYVFGIDRSENMIDICNQRSPQIPFEICDITHGLPSEHNFDYAIFNNSLQDMSCFGIGLKNTLNLLKDNGTMLIVVKHPCFHPRKNNLGWKMVSQSGQIKSSGYGLSELCYLENDYKAEFFMMDDYFDSSSHERDWFGDKTLSYARMLETYVNTFIDCGYRIKRIYEPRPIRDGEMENKFLYTILNRIPNFIIFCLQKEKHYECK